MLPTAGVNELLTVQNIITVTIDTVPFKKKQKEQNYLKQQKKKYQSMLIDIHLHPELGKSFEARSPTVKNFRKYAK